jgi:hypothetical protein
MKKAFMKTIEVLLAATFTALFLFETSLDVLANLEKNDAFRDFATLNTGCFNSTSNTDFNREIDKYVPIEYDYLACIDASSYTLPDKKIFIDSIVISGNLSLYRPKTVKLYHWLK